MTIMMNNNNLINHSATKSKYSNHSSKNSSKNSKFYKKPYNNNRDKQNLYYNDNTNLNFKKSIKLTTSHLDYIKELFDKDNFIGPTEVKILLKEVIGLEVNYLTVEKALNNIKEDSDLENSILNPNSDKNKQSSSSSKLKDFHLQSLKKYLTEDNYLGPTEAKKLLQQETGLEISYSTIQKNLTKLRKEMGLERCKLDSSFVKTRQLSPSQKFKDIHLECLRKYLTEDKSITSTFVKIKLEEETGLILCTKTITKYLTDLRAELFPDYINLNTTSSSKVSKLNERSKLKDCHLELIKKYQIENNLIGPTKLKNLLKEETGLEVSISTIRKALAKLKNEIGLEDSNLDQATINSKQSNNRSKLKDYHLESLTRYLLEDNHIGPTEAKKLLQQETGLEISYSTIQKYLTNLRNEMNLEYSKLNSSTIKTKKIKNLSELNFLHVDCIKRYLKEDSLIGVKDLKLRLKEDTGLDFSILSIGKTLKTLS